MRNVRSIGYMLGVVLLALAISVCAQDLLWVSMGTAPISGGYGEAVEGTGESIYLLRCLDATSDVLFYRYQPETGVWHEESVAGLPEGTFRNGTAMAWDGASGIYALGGARYSDEDRREFYRFDTVAQSWTSIAQPHYPQGAGNALTWSGFDSMLYALIGSRSHDSKQSHFVRYDPEKGWQDLEAPWENTDDGASLAWTGDNYIFALRGEYIEDSSSHDFSRYDISTGQWTRMADFPDQDGAGDGGSLLWIGQWLPEQADVLYALSGGSADEDPGYGMFVYSISTGEWERVSDIPCPIGHYVGNRLGYAAGMIYYWQGSPQSERWMCGGDGFFAAQIGYPTAGSTP